MIKEEKVQEFIDEVKEEINEKNLYNISPNNLKVLHNMINKKAKEKFGELINHSPQGVGEVSIDFDKDLEDGSDNHNEIDVRQLNEIVKVGSDNPPKTGRNMGKAYIPSEINRPKDASEDVCECGHTAGNHNRKIYYCHIKGCGCKKFKPKNAN